MSVRIVVYLQCTYSDLVNVYVEHDAMFNLIYRYTFYIWHDSVSCIKHVIVVKKEGYKPLYSMYIFSS